MWTDAAAATAAWVKRVLQMKICFTYVIRIFLSFLEQHQGKLTQYRTNGQTKNQERHHDTGRGSLVVGLRHHFGREHHADGADVAGGHGEKNHDDDVNEVRLENDRSDFPVVRAGVAQQKQGHEGQAQDGSQQHDERTISE
jgi:hypothetical protein